MLNGKILAFAIRLGIYHLRSYDSLCSKSHVALGSPLLLPVQNLSESKRPLYIQYCPRNFHNNYGYSFYIMIKSGNKMCVVFTIY